MRSSQPLQVARDLTVLDQAQRSRRAQLLAPIALAAAMLPTAVKAEPLDLRHRDADGRTPLHRAAASGDVDAIAELLAAGASLQARDELGFTPLLTAVAEGSPASVRALLDARDPNGDEATSTGYLNEHAPLTVAARRGDVPILREIVASGATRGELRKAAYVALISEHEDAALWLMRTPETKRSTGPRHGHPNFLRRAAQAESLALLDLLLEEGVTSGAQSALLTAAMSGRAAVVDRLLDAGTAPDPGRAGTWTPLSRALQAGHLDIARRLRDAGASTTVSLAGGYTMLHAAAASGDVEIVRELLDAGADVNARAHARQTPLDVADFHGCDEIARLLRERGGTRDVTSNRKSNRSMHARPTWLAGYSVRYCDGHGPPPPDPPEPRCSHEAVFRNPELLESCLRAGAALDQARLLATACQAGDVESAAVLLRHVADVNAPIGDTGAPPLLLAAASGHGDVVRLFLDAGADPNVADDSGRTALHFAAGAGDVTTVDRLLAAGADARRETESCATTLHFAAISGPAEIVERLWSRGANASSACTDGAAALLPGVTLAAWAQDTPIKSQLIRAFPTCGTGEWPELTGHVVTPLHVAALSNEVDIIQELLALGSDPNEPSRRGVTPLHVAARYSGLAAAEVLLEAGSDPNAVASVATPTGSEPERVHLTPWDVARGGMMRRLLEAHGATPGTVVHPW